MPPSIAARNITSVLQEKRVFKPAKKFAAQAHIKSLAHYKRLYAESIKSPDRFWDKQAKQELAWFKPFTLQYEFTYAGVGKKGGY
jgi:acetyl-CoA synthetase